jgi:hypothetical protein
VIKSVDQYLLKITGLKGYFNLLKSGKNRVAVFRRLSFIAPDQWTMIRLRLMSEVEPWVQTSVLNGFLVGEVRIDGKGKITRGFDANRVALLDYLLREPMGAHLVEKLGERCFKIHFPGDWVEVLIARASRMEGKTPRASVRAQGWHVRVGKVSFEIERFKETCLVRATPERWFALIRADRLERKRFLQLSRPCILTAFGRTVDVSGALHHASEWQGQLSDRVFARLFATYERVGAWNASGLFGKNGRLAIPVGKSVKDVFLSGRRLRRSPRWPLTENHCLPIPALLVPTVKFKDAPYGPRPKLDVPIPPCPGRGIYRQVVRQQYAYLRGCIHPEEVVARINGRRVAGVMSAVDQAIYPPIWVPDHFFNCIAMVDFDPSLARRMILGGFAACMRSSGQPRGQIPLKRGREGETTYPVWAVACQRLFARTADLQFARQVLPLLRANNDFHSRFYLRDGIYVGAGGFWNDYSQGPKALSHVAGIGMNSLLALQKRIAFEMGLALGVRDEKLWDEYESLKENINRRFWDAKRGFYFDHDHHRGQVYTTERGGRFFGLDNLLPLFAGFVPEERIGSIARYLTSSHYYGKYPAITTDLSDDFMDERRLMVWVMTDWLVIQGLRKHRLHGIADAISRQIFNALLRSWAEGQSLPEALGGNLGLCPMENRTLAGVGCWTGFWLYLKEALRPVRR